MTLDRIREECSNTFFCQVSKWGKDLSEQEAISLGLLKSSTSEKTPASKRNPRKPRINTNNNKEVSE